MAQETLVLALSPREQERLREGVEGGDFEHRHVDHALFSVRGEGVVATLYRSGKLVVQGEAPRLFAERYVGRADAAAPAGKPARTAAGGLADATKPLVGSDEAGKGDFFGPLVVAAVRVEPAERAGLARAGVADGKRLADGVVRRLAAFLEERFPCAVERLDPPEYNRLHARCKNLNTMLADLHARAIRRLAGPGMAVLVDRFAAESLLAGRLADTGIVLRQVPRAEAELAVAAASIVARGIFLQALDELSDEVACDLAKGAGEPADRAARRFVAIHGADALDRVAKLHFKNSARVPRG